MCTNTLTPLYQNLKKEATSTADLTAVEKDLFQKKIKALDERGNEMVYVLIRMYEFETLNTLLELPFESKFQTKTELKFTLDNLPVQLKRIIYSFLNLHIDKMNEEAQLVTARKAMGVKN